MRKKGGCNVGSNTTEQETSNPTRSQIQKQGNVLRHHDRNLDHQVPFQPLLRSFTLTHIVPVPNCTSLSSPLPSSAASTSRRRDGFTGNRGRVRRVINAGKVPRRLKYSGLRRSAEVHIRNVSSSVSSSNRRLRSLRAVRTDVSPLMGVTGLGGSSVGSETNVESRVIVFPDE